MVNHVHQMLVMELYYLHAVLQVIAFAVDFYIGMEHIVVRIFLFSIWILHSIF